MAKGSSPSLLRTVRWDLRNNSLTQSVPNFILKSICIYREALSHDETIAIKQKGLHYPSVYRWSDACSRLWHSWKSLRLPQVEIYCLNIKSKTCERYLRVDVMHIIGMRSPEWTVTKSILRHRNSSHLSDHNTWPARSAEKTVRAGNLTMALEPHQWAG